MLREVSGVLTKSELIQPHYLKAEAEVRMIMLLVTHDGYNFQQFRIFCTGRAGISTCLVKYSSLVFLARLMTAGRGGDQNIFSKTEDSFNFILIFNNHQLMRIVISCS